MMAARAIWKGQLVIGRQQVPVKMYSAVEDRKVHFRLLHEKDHEPVEQRIVRKDNGDEVAKDAQRKAFPLDDEIAVIVQPEELESLEPPASREIHLCRFVPPEAISDQWFDRPYYLGPDEDDGAYFALAQALGERRRVGIARWVMRGKRYVGALGLAGPCLTMITLRRAEQVLSLPAVQPDKSRSPTDQELKLAQQLLESIAGDFEPQQWQDQHRARLYQLIEAKARGEKVKMLKPRRRAPAADLAASLRKSIAATKERKVA